MARERTPRASARKGPALQATRAASKRVSLRVMKLSTATCALLLVLAAALPRVALADSVLELRLATPPHAPADAPDVMVHVPSRFDASRPVLPLIFLHGFSSC